MKPIRVIVGPLFLALRYARLHRLRPDQYTIVTDSAALHHLDPLYITAIIKLVDGARFLTRRGWTHLNQEIASITRLWNLPVIEHAARRVSRAVHPAS
jgi:hypothetical protein